MTTHPNVIRVVLLSALVAAAGCASPGYVKAEKAIASTLISTQEENQLGAQLHQQLQQQGMKFDNNPTVVNYVNEVARPILAVAQKARPDVKWQIFVVDTPDVNAFATPGGYLYVQTGLLRAVKNDAELAGVLAHEAGHVVGRHAARNMVEQYGLQTVAGFALGQNPSQVKQIAASLLANGILLHYSRSQETEADEYGAKFARAAGYDPKALISFFQTLQAQSGKQPGFMTWLSDHPATSDRIAHLQQYIAANHLSGGQLDLHGNALAQAQQALGPAPAATGGAGR